MLCDIDYIEKRKKKKTHNISKKTHNKKIARES